MFGALQIVPCPPSLVEQAFALVLAEFAPAERRAIAAHAPTDALIVALRAGTVVDAAWGQPQPGNTAVLWPPRTCAGEESLVAGRLIAAAAAALDAAGVRMTQALVARDAVPTIAALQAAGFAHLVDLQYLAWQSAPTPPPELLEFATYRDDDAERLARVVEATYLGTRDCPGMNGMRPMNEVLAGYRGTGRYRPENWLFARQGGDDVGVLLLTEHQPEQDDWELMYMGLAPSYRGRGWGRDLVRQAQQLAHNAGAKRLLLAVDAANEPALATYRRAGFMGWDERTVYVRFRDAARDHRPRE